MIIIILALLYVLAFVLVCRLFHKREGYYSTVAIFGIAAYIYYVGIPIEMSLSNSTTIVTAYASVTLTTSQLEQIVLMSIGAFLSFSLGYGISGFNPFRQSSLRTDATSRKPIRYSVVLLWILVLVVIPLMFYGKIQSVSTYVGVYTTFYQNPYFALVTQIAVVTTAIIAATTIRKGKVKHMLLGASLVLAIATWAVYSNNKGSLLLGFLALGACLFVWRMNRRFSSLVLLVFLVAIGILLFIMFNLHRGGVPLSDLSAAFERLSLTKFDPAGPFISLAHIMANPASLKWGATYTDVFTLLIPKAVWSGRPLDLSEQFARQVIPDWQSGQGLGFSLLAEAYLNFSWFGAFIQYLLIGLLWGYFWRVLRRAFFWHYSTPLWQSFYTTIGYYLLIIMHRGPFAVITKTLILLTAPFVLFAIFFDLSMINRKNGNSKNETELLRPE